MGIAHVDDNPHSGTFCRCKLGKVHGTSKSAETGNARARVVVWIERPISDRQKINVSVLIIVIIFDYKLIVRLL